MMGTAPYEKFIKAPLIAETVPQKMEYLIAEHDIPGLNFSIIYKNGTQKDFTVGYEDVENRIPLSKDKLLLSGSIGKTYAVAILMDMVDFGKISLDDKIKDYFPELKWMDRIPNIDAITIEMLLQHTSGLPRWVMKREVWERLADEPDKVWTYEDRFSYIFDMEAVHEPGKGWAYSDTNYLLIGMLIEKLTGEYYYKTVKKHLLLPYELKETRPSDKRKVRGLSMAYSKLPEAYRIPGKVVSKGKYTFNPQMEWTGGGMASTTADLARWAKLYYSGELFSKNLLSKMTTVNEGSKMAEQEDPYGMGSFVYDTELGTAWGHSGFMPGYNSIFAWYPKHEIAVALQTNCDYMGSKIKLKEAMTVLTKLALEDE